MKKNKNITILTILSALTFCAFIIFASLTPLSSLGKNANQFNSSGMWASIVFIIATYIIPLILFYIYPKVGKVILAIFCGLGIMIFLSSFAIFILLGMVLGIMSSLISMLIICSMGFIINIIWFIVAFVRQPNQANPSLQNHIST